jgi:hypothetical protein
VRNRGDGGHAEQGEIFRRTLRVDGRSIPFSAGQLVKLRTRVRNGNGSATSAVRSLSIV